MFWGCCLVLILQIDLYPYSYPLMSITRFFISSIRRVFNRGEDLFMDIT